MIDVTRKLTLLPILAAGTVAIFSSRQGLDARAACIPSAVMSPQGNGTGANASLSADGRFMAFESSANNLVPGDSGQTDIFVFDRLTCAIERVSVNSAEVQANGSSFDPAISDDGRFVVFESGASNLAPDTNGGTLDVFLRDRQLGTTSLVSIGFDGTQGSLQSQDPEISGNGLVVVFISRNTLVANDTNNEADVFVRDLLTQMTERASIATDGSQGDSPSTIGVAQPALSGDGRFVTFASSMNTLVSDDFNNVSDIFVRDRQSSTTVRVSVSSSGAEATTVSTSPSISADGSLVAFDSGSNIASLIPLRLGNGALEKL